jgi:hypothetical protein
VSAGEVERVEITLPIRCEVCGEVTRVRLNPEQAGRLARGLLAAADGLDQTDGLDVRGEG